MDYTSIHIYGHLLSDDILHEIETDSSQEKRGRGAAPFFFFLSLIIKIDGAGSASVGRGLRGAPPPPPPHPERNPPPPGGGFLFFSGPPTL